jgi:hypothetical protein
VKTILVVAAPAVIFVVVAARVVGFVVAALAAIFVVVAPVVISTIVAPVAQFVAGLSGIENIVVEQSWLMIEGCSQ